MGWWEDTHPEVKVEKRKPRCKRKVINFGRKVYRAFGPKTRHWPNLRHDDAACGAWGTWRIPMGGLATHKSDVTCKKCRRLCGLDGGPDLRRTHKMVDRRTHERRLEKQRKARLKRWAKNEAATVMSKWRMGYIGGSLEQSGLESLIAEALLKAKGCRS